MGFTETVSRHYTYTFERGEHEYIIDLPHGKFADHIDPAIAFNEDGSFEFTYAIWDEYNEEDPIGNLALQGYTVKPFPAGFWDNDDIADTLQEMYMGYFALVIAFNDGRSQYTDIHTVQKGEESCEAIIEALERSRTEHRNTEFYWIEFNDWDSLKDILYPHDPIESLEETCKEWREVAQGNVFGICRVYYDSEGEPTGQDHETVWGFIGTEFTDDAIKEGLW